jgi:acyl-CoA hydrolase
MKKPRVYQKDFVVFPSNTNNVGTLFGGYLMSQMDLSAAVLTRKLLYDTDCDGCVTASMDGVSFKCPAYVGDLVEVVSELKRIGKSSVEILTTATKEDQKGNRTQICKAKFVFVALKDKVPSSHNLTWEQIQD